MGAMGFGPGNIDCDAVLADVYLYLDNETDEGLRDRIRQHLDGCAPCLAQFGIEQDVRALISRCCGSDRAPASLHQRVRLRITEASADGVTETVTEVSVERTFRPE
ncbi:mycothiol system anti-sigma-R factor [Jatrophihabitans endophyticus]|uniref:Mycothiol system anti-sigma-R factor n=1 Tax=Jatrophihabitans endophyticus TaxID=1206085 RepID=A0A1M5EAB4_9ACTN|nr:mycothiol system anti-sigma-R factor [Jatrophihabitans endophyticus]SHF76135.1 mycothiol system anti-sigma-R factor [Jatrophihabitans endophyticus]